ncbi:unnamed protein product, partial [Ectocarpus fasciculatus]
SDIGQPSYYASLENNEIRLGVLDMLFLFVSRKQFARSATGKSTFDESTIGLTQNIHVSSKRKRTPILGPIARSLCRPPRAPTHHNFVRVGMVDPKVQKNR